MEALSVNLRRLMARQGLSVADVVRRSRLDERTVKGMLAGRHRPHARSLHKLAEGLGVDPDELFQDPSLLLHRWFDRRTNPVVTEVVESRPDLFRGWTEGDFDELYSRFGCGGALTAEGVAAAARAMARNRRVQRKVALILETGEAEVLEAVVEALYRRVAVESADGLQHAPMVKSCEKSVER